jgi:SAM-dependent methyltransferase
VSKDTQIDTKEMVDGFYNADIGQDLPEYEIPHIPRYKDVIKYLEKIGVTKHKVCDMGCGPGYILKNMKGDNELVGVDGTLFQDDKVRFYKANLDYDKFSEDIPEKDVEHMLCFETFEHLTNPYHFILECKKMMKIGGYFHLSYPTEVIQHNTFYPALLWPQENFVEFMNQMAFQLHHQFILPTRFGGVHFFAFKNLGWSEIKMRYPKPIEDNGQEPPHVQVNG